MRALLKYGAAFLLAAFLALAVSKAHACREEGEDPAPFDWSVILCPITDV